MRTPDLRGASQPNSPARFDKTWLERKNMKGYQAMAVARQNLMISPTSRKSAFLFISIAALLAIAVTLSAQSPAQPINLSTRLRVQTGDNVGIAGVIISGTGAKHVLIRAIGPSLTQSGISGALADPTLELHNSNGVVLFANDNWKDSPQRAFIEASGIPPKNDLESAIDWTFATPESFTAIIRGKDNATGVGLIEVYDLDPDSGSRLANISTRAFVETGSNIVIAGFVLGKGTAQTRIVIRGLGPSLEDRGIQNVLPDPQVEVRNAGGTLIISNDDWADSSSQASQLSDLGLAPDEVLESGLVAAFAPGAYTALLSDFRNRSGVGLVEIYDLASLGASMATVQQLKAGDTYHIEKQHVSFEDAQTTGTFVIQVYKPTVINSSGISARAALLGQTDPIPFSATAEDIVDALTAIPNSYYAYDQPGNLELIEGSFSYFASAGAVNREPVVTLDGKTAAAGFTIEFGSLVGTTSTFTGYNTWVAGMPRISVSIPDK
jgi:hypothetical protein